MPSSGAPFDGTIDCHSDTEPMTTATRFGKKLRVPATFQIKYELLRFWLSNQAAKEAAENNPQVGGADTVGVMVADSSVSISNKLRTTVAGEAIDLNFRGAGEPKGRLLKGPKDFRDLQRDYPRKKL